jgi:hypothetical protein
MSSEPMVTTQSVTAGSEIPESERGLLLAMLVMVLLGAAAMLLMTS